MANTWDMYKDIQVFDKISMTLYLDCCCCVDAMTLMANTCDLYIDTQVFDISIILYLDCCCCVDARTGKAMLLLTSGLSAPGAASG